MGTGYQLEVYLKNKEQRGKLERVAVELGYIRGVYGAPTPNLSAMLQDIAEGYAVVVRKEYPYDTPGDAGAGAR